MPPRPGDTSDGEFFIPINCWKLAGTEGAGEEEESEDGCKPEPRVSIDSIDWLAVHAAPTEKVPPPPPLPT